MASSTKLLAFATLVVCAGILMLGNLPGGFSAPVPPAPVPPAGQCRGDPNRINRECSGSGGWPTPKQACCVALRLADVVCHCARGTIGLKAQRLVEMCKACVCDPRFTADSVCRVLFPPPRLAPPRLPPPTTMALA